MLPEPMWFPESDEPINDGWYAVQRKDGSLCLRAWGDGAWWIPLRDGWLSGLPPGFRWMGPVEPMEWDTPREPTPSPAGTATDPVIDAARIIDAVYSCDSDTTLGSIKIDFHGERMYLQRAAEAWLEKPTPFPAATAPVDPVAAYERHLAVEKGRVQVWGERVAEPAPCAKCEPCNGKGVVLNTAVHSRAGIKTCPRCTGTGYLPGEIVRDVTGREGALRCPCSQGKG